MRVLDQLRKAAPVTSSRAHHRVVHLFSEGQPGDFGSLLKVPRVQLHLNEPVADTLHTW